MRYLKWALIYLFIFTFCGFCYHPIDGAVVHDSESSVTVSAVVPFVEKKISFSTFTQHCWLLDVPQWRDLSNDLMLLMLPVLFANFSNVLLHLYDNSYSRHVLLLHQLSCKLKNHRNTLSPLLPNRRAESFVFLKKLMSSPFLWGFFLFERAGKHFKAPSHSFKLFKPNLNAFFKILFCPPFCMDMSCE